MSALGYCEHCGWPVAPEGVTLTGSDAEPREGARSERCDDTACTVAGPVTVRRPARDYEDRDDSLAACAADVAAELALTGWDLAPSWDDANERQWIVLTVPAWAVTS